MHRVILTILSVFYLFTATGATVYNHYCMGNLVDVGTAHAENKTCGNCGMEKSTEKDNGCCSETLQFSESAGDEQLLKEPSLNFTQPVAILSVIFNITQQAAFSAAQSTLPVNRSQFLPDKYSIQILNCIFRI